MFFQDPPKLGNQYQTDPVLDSLLRRLTSVEVYEAIHPDLMRFGEAVAGPIAVLGDEAERDQPRLMQYDAWGRRVDDIQVSEAWHSLDEISAREGLVAIAYERTYGAYSRLYQFAKLYLFHPSSAVYTCPLAMTDGAARLIEVYGDEAMKRDAFRRLTSRDPASFWTSGQWMTERRGGSDVGRSETIARFEDGVWRLYGDKWFTSATTSQMAMTLARVVQADGSTTTGSRGLSVFYLETRDSEGALNGIEINRLKEKLGTKALPTAELRLAGAQARMVGEPGSGVRQIATMINVTRVYNSICAVATLRRGLALARDYAKRRHAFGKPLSEQPLHVETLADLEAITAGCTHLTFLAAELMGRLECGEGEPGDEAVLRLLTPLVKLYTGKCAVNGISELLECFGGAGYIENTGLPRLLRDAQVLPIWEGTTNVLSLDALRAIERDEALPALLKTVERYLATANLWALSEEVAQVRAALEVVTAYVNRGRSEEREWVEAGARDFAFALARITGAALLLAHASWTHDHDDGAYHVAAAKRWCAMPLADLRIANVEHRRQSQALLD